MHGKEEICEGCQEQRLSVIDEAVLVLACTSPDTREYRVILRLVAFVSMYAAMQTIHDQEDLLSRLGPLGDSMKLPESLFSGYEALYAAFMAMTSRCTKEFGEDKCKQVD